MTDYEHLARSRRREEIAETWIGAVAVVGVIAALIGQLMGWIE